MKTDPLDFNPDLMIKELGQLASDVRQGDVSKYRITSVVSVKIENKSPRKIQTLRKRKLRLSRSAFAQILDVPLETLRSWEKGRRTPSGAANRLLDIFDHYPKLAWNYIKTKPAQPRSAAKSFGPVPQLAYKKAKGKRVVPRAKKQPKTLSQARVDGRPLRRAKKATHDVAPGSLLN